VAVVIEASVTDREKEQEVPPASLVEDENLRFRVPLRKRFGSRESFFICSVRIAAGIVIEVATIAVDDTND